MKKYILEAIVFLSGAVVMILEMVGSRVLAPHLGTSVVVWTSLIGIILGSLSLGYWWGGKLADQGATRRQFSFILFLSSVLVLIVALSKLFVLIFISNVASGFYLKAVLASALLFAAPSVTLGMVSPYAVRLKMKDLNTSGRTVGNLYAISTVGSIAGTFLAGFVLIAFFSATSILFVLSALLLLSSLSVYFENGKKSKFAVLLFIIAAYAVSQAWGGLAVASGRREFETPYNHVTISDGQYRRNGRPMRLLRLATEWSSAMYLDKDDDLVFDYTKFYRLARHFNSNINTALMIGGGAYSYPKDFLKQYPNASIDVVEIDAKLTQLAKDYFNLRHDSRLQIFHEDGRVYLNQNRKKYDAIFGDAFKSHSPPYQLTTQESVQKMCDSLNDNGVAIINVISSIKGDKGKFLRAELATFRSVFPRVYLFPVEDSDNPNLTQNQMLVAIKGADVPLFESKDLELNDYLQNRWVGEIANDMPALTDEYAPVENYLIQVGAELSGG